MHVLPLQADDVDQQPLGQPVLAHHPGRPAAAVVGELQVPVALDREQPVALHPGHGLATRSGRSGRAARRSGRAAGRCPPPRARRWSAGTSRWCRSGRSRGCPISVSASADPSSAVAARPHRAVRCGGARRTYGRRGARHRPVAAPRPAAARQPGPARGGRRGGRRPRAAAVRRSTRALWRPAGAPRRAWLLRSLAALRRVDATARWSCARGDPVRGRARPSRTSSARDAVHVSADSGPYGRGATSAVEAALAGGGRPLVRTGSPYAVGPGAVTKADGDAVPGVHAVLPGLARPRLAGAGRAAAAGAALGRGSTRERPAGRAGPGAASSCPRRARRPRASAGQASWPSALDDYADRPRPARPGRHLAAVGAPEVRRDPPAHAAGRPGRRARRRRARRSAASWPGASSTPTSCGTTRTAPGSTCGPSSRAMRVRPSRADGVRRLARGPHRLPVRRRRHAPAAARGLDAQPGADGRRPASWSRTCTWSGSTAPGTSCAGCATATWPATSTAGSGWPAAAPTPRRTSGSSTRSTQGRKFDPDGDVRPALGARARAPARAPPRTSRGSTPTATPHGYPQRVVDHAAERARGAGAATRTCAADLGGLSAPTRRRRRPLGHDATRPRLADRSGSGRRDGNPRRPRLRRRGDSTP